MYGGVLQGTVTSLQGVVKGAKKHNSYCTQPVGQPEGSETFSLVLSYS